MKQIVMITDGTSRFTFEDGEFKKCFWSLILWFVSPRVGGSFQVQTRRLAVNTFMLASAYGLVPKFR